MKRIVLAFMLSLALVCAIEFDEDFNMDQEMEEDYETESHESESDSFSDSGLSDNESEEEYDKKDLPKQAKNQPDPFKLELSPDGMKINWGLFGDVPGNIKKRLSKKEKTSSEKKEKKETSSEKKTRKLSREESSKPMIKHRVSGPPDSPTAFCMKHNAIKGVEISHPKRFCNYRNTHAYSCAEDPVSKAAHASFFVCHKGCDPITRKCRV